MGGYVVLDRTLDQLFLTFTGISADDFKGFVATGANDDEVAAWVQENATSHTQEEIAQWSNDLRFKHISEMPIEFQVFLEGRVVNFWFDFFHIEEGRL